MKKAIILSGPIASGKTWISFGIMEFFHPGEWIYTSFSREDAKKQNLTNFKLMIVDDCIDLREIESYSKLRMKYPHCNFIFCTQSSIEKCDTSKFHLIKLKQFSNG